MLFLELPALRDEPETYVQALFPEPMYLYSTPAIYLSRRGWNDGPVRIL